MSLFLASPPCGAVARATRMFGERKESSPQRRAPPCIAETTSSVSHWCLSLADARCPIVQAFGVHPRTTPLLVFIPSSRGIAYATVLCFARQGRRSSFSPGRFLAEIARGSFTLVLFLQKLSTHWAFCFASLTKILNESCASAYALAHPTLSR